MKKKSLCTVSLAVVLIGIAPAALAKEVRFEHPLSLDETPRDARRAINQYVRWIEERFGLRLGPAPAPQPEPRPVSLGGGEEPSVCPVPLERGHCPVG